MQRLRPVLLTALLLVLSACTGEREADLEERARAVHEAVLTLDTHVDIPFEFATAAADPLDGDLQVNLLKMREGGLDAAFFIVYVEQGERTADGYADAVRGALTKFDAIQRMARMYPGHIAIAQRADDVERLRAEGLLVAAIGIENGFVIGTDLELLDRYHRLGGRYLTLVHNGHNDLADSAQPRPALGDTLGEHGGVSELGARAIARMNDLGIMVDISHASKETALHAIRLSRAPVIASHSNVRAVANHVRNLDDETLLALRDNGGVLQTTAYDAFLKIQPPERQEALAALRARFGLADAAAADGLPPEQREAYQGGLDEIDGRWPPASVADLVDHIDYAVALIGIDHVGISSDFGGGGGVVGWADALETPNVTRELVRRGYSDEDIAKLWAGNLLRVWREAERVAG